MGASLSFIFLKVTAHSHKRQHERHPLLTASTKHLEPSSDQLLITTANRASRLCFTVKFNMKPNFKTAFRMQ